MNDHPLAALREIRASLRELRTCRNACIRQAKQAGYSERRIALAAGLSKSQVHRVLH